MADIEKVIKGLECCTKFGCHHGCEYKSNGYSGMTCRQELERDALELLKEQANAYHYLQKQFFEVQDKLLSQPQIVRCKDCKYYIEPTEEEAGGCLIKAGYFPVSENWFCADGERK